MRTLPIAILLALSMITLAAPAPAAKDVPVGACSELTGACPATACFGISKQVPTCLDACSNALDATCDATLCAETSDNVAVDPVCSPDVAIGGVNDVQVVCINTLHADCPGVFCVYWKGRPSCYLGPPSLDD